MDYRYLVISLVLAVIAVCTALEEGMSQDSNSVSLSSDHNPHKRSTSQLSPEEEEDVMLTGDDDVYPVEDPSKRGGLLRYGKRGSLFRFGKRGSLFRFGKRGSLFRFGKRGSLFRFGKRGSLFRFGKRGNLFRFGRSGDNMSPLVSDEDVKRGSLFRFGKRSDDDSLPSYPLYLDENKREVDGFHWGQADDQ